MRWRCLLVWLSLALCGQASAQNCPSAQTLSYEVIRHDARDALRFTQGLTFADGLLVESTGLYGRSQLIVHHPSRDETIDLPRRVFGEGLAVHNQRLWQLSWKSGQLRIYTMTPLALEKTLSYRGEGWGLTHDGTRFIRSDGTAWLRFHNDENFAPIGQVQVRDGEQAINRLNELEWVNDQVLANIWFSDRIARIDPNSGCVTGWLDLTSLWPRAIRPPSADVLNGVAWHAGRQELWVTGKNWPRIYHLDVPALKLAKTTR